MDNMSEEDRHIETIDLNQEDCTSQIPSDANKNNLKDKNFRETELQNKPPYRANKELCLHSNHNQFGIIKLDTVSICIICKTVIHFSELDPCNKNHLISNEHKVNQFELFKQCFYDPGLYSKNTIQNYISNNSSIDFSSATEISTSNKNVNCFVCKIEIPSLGSCENVWIADVLYHLKDENHNRNVQDNFSWTCDLPSRGHVTFYKTLFYCSVCEESTGCDDFDLIPTAVSHLETKHRECFTSHGFEVETVVLVKKTSHSTDSSASDASFDFDGMEEISDDLYTTCEDESSFVDDDAYLTADTHEVSLPKVKDEETENNKHEDLSHVCVESGGNMERVGDELEVKVHLRSVSHEKESNVSLVLPAQKHNVEHSFLSVEKKVETLDYYGSAKNCVSQQLAADEHPKRVLIEELSICNPVIIPKGNKNQDLKQTSVEQKCLTKTKSYTDKRLFSDLYDCLPASFHKDLSFVTIKSNQFHCELCICFIGVVLNVFDSSFILHSHFCLIYHKNQMDLFSKPVSENKKPDVKRNLSNIGTKRDEKKIIISSNLTDGKLTDINKTNQRNHVPLASTTTANSQTNIASTTTSNEYKNISDLQDMSSKRPIVKKQTEVKGVTSSPLKLSQISKNKKILYLQDVSSIAISNAQKQNEIHDIFSNIQTFRKQTEVKVFPSSPLKPTQISTDKKLLDLQDVSSIAISNVQKQNEIHDIYSNIQTFPKQTEVKGVAGSPLKLAQISKNKNLFDLQNISSKRPSVKKQTDLDVIASIQDTNKTDQRNHVPLASTTTANSQTNIASTTTSSEDEKIFDLQNISSKRPSVKKQTDLDVIASIQDTNKTNQRNHVSLASTTTANSQTNIASTTTSSEDEDISDLQDSSSKRPIVKKQTDLDVIASIALSKVQKQNDRQDNFSNIPTVPRQTEIKVVPSCSPLIPTKVNNEIDITKLKTLLPSPLIDLFSDSNLTVHHEFFKHILDGIYCCLCSSKVSANPVDLKNHITGITHKVQFLSQLKKSLNKHQRYQVKFLMFINGLLYCSLCKCFVSPRDSFVGICKEVEDHFEMDAHSSHDGENKIKSGETCQGIMTLNKKIPMTEAEIHSDSLNLMTNETAGAKKENKQKIRNVLIYSLSQKSQGALVEDPPEASKLVADISNHSYSGLLNHGTLPNVFDMKQKPEKELSKDSHDNNVDISKVNESFKIDLSFKRLIATAPLVRVNKDFIEQVGANFYCILCSMCIPYSPQKYVLAKNFNVHFKSASHVSNVNKISKVENIPRMSKIMKGKSKKTCRLAIDKSSKTTEKTSFSTACDKFDMDKVSPTEQSLPKKDSQSNESIVNPKSSENKSIKVYKTSRVTVSTNRTSALKRFMNKYKLDKDLNLFENNLSISNKQVSQKLHPLLQKLVPDVPLLQLNKQHILRRNINFYCTLCCKDISFSTKRHVLARYFNVHFKSKTHNSFLQTENSGLEHEKQASVDRSTKSPSMCQPRSTASNAERGLCNVLNEGKSVFKTIYTTLTKFKNEDIFFCNYCIKHIRTIPYRSFEYSIIQHCFKIHRRESKLQHSGIVSDVIWKNNILKSNITFMEVSQEAAACGICCAGVHFSKNYSILTSNFLVHFQDEKHKLVVRSTRQSNLLPSVGGKSKKYKPNLKAYEGN